MTYCSVDDCIFQRNPIYDRCSQYPKKGWTETIIGAINEAEREVQLLARNGPYTFGVSLNLEAVLTPKEIIAVWNKIQRNLRKQIIAEWIREPSRSNHCNYHLLVKSQHEAKELHRIIKESIPDGITNHIQERPLATQGDAIRWIRYILKAKVSGYLPNGKFTYDKWGSKRLLFKSGLGLKKLGTIGPFWDKPKCKMKAEFKAEQEQIEAKGIGPLADHIWDFLGGAVSLQEIRRNLAYSWETEAIKTWAEKIAG
jgi:hypothetical protein